MMEGMRSAVPPQESLEGKHLLRAPARGTSLLGRWRWAPDSSGTGRGPQRARFGMVARQR